MRIALNTSRVKLMRNAVSNQLHFLIVGASLTHFFVTNRSIYTLFLIIF